MAHPSGKRKIEVIDLTDGSSDCSGTHVSSQRSKMAKPSISPLPSRQLGRTSNTSSYITPPSSSQPNSSQCSSSQDARTNTYGQTRDGAGYTSLHGYNAVSQSVRNAWLASTQELEEDVRREIDLTQDVDDDIYTDFELYGILNTKIVGVRFYDGRATTGEFVIVKREPGKCYNQKLTIFSVRMVLKLKRQSR